MKTKTKRVKKVAVKPYSATIKILGKMFTSTGSTALEAIENLAQEGKCAGGSVLTITKGDEKREKILPAFQTFRLFSKSKMMRQLALKGVSSLFNI